MSLTKKARAAPTATGGSHVAECPQASRADVDLPDTNHLFVNQTLVEIVSELKELEVLILDDCKGVNGTGLLTALVKCKELRQLSMAGLNLRDCPNWLASLPETIQNSTSVDAN